MMKPAFQTATAFLDDARQALSAGKRRLWWLGQSGFLIVHKGRAFVLDPYLSDSLTLKYAATDKPHARMTERVVDPSALGSLGVIDVITSSHNHTDHLDAETLEPLLDLNPVAKLVIPAANHEFVTERLGTSVASRLVELDNGTSTTVAGVEFHGIAAAHPTIERDGSNRCKFLGYVLRVGGFTIYHSGDTLLHDQLAESLRPFRIDLALLPINGDRPERRVAGNLDGRQAAGLARDIGARLVIPCHFDLFEFNTASPDEFVAECRQMGQLYRVLRNGEALEF
jgi:L-ascorbate metabolism protein UlaG (beta-lactamase superfamily)